MSTFDTPPAVALADTCRCAAAGPPLRWPGASAAQAGPQALRDEWMAGWLSALVHSLYLDQESPEAAPGEADGTPVDAQERCLHCQRPFDFSHKRAALLILAQRQGVEQRRVIEQAWGKRACSR